MNLRDLKLHLLESLAQIVVFRKSGEILDSCDSLVGLEAVVGKSAYETFPLVESMREVINLHQNAGKPISIPCVEFTYKGFTGVFDFSFSSHPQDSQLVVWTWVDQTDIYEYLRKIQQERNMLLVDQEDEANGKDIDRWGIAG